MSSTAWSQTINKDLRTDLSGTTAQQIAGPGAVTTQPGSVGVAAGDYSNLNLNLTGAKFKAGMSGAEVKDLVTSLGGIQEQTVARVADFAQSTLAAQSTALTGQIPNWQRYIPWAIGGVVIIAIAMRSRRRS